jgi:hypothetical protein
MTDSISRRWLAVHRRIPLPAPYATCLQARRAFGDELPAPSLAASTRNQESCNGHAGNVRATSIQYACVIQAR